MNGNQSANRHLPRRPERSIPPNGRPASKLAACYRMVARLGMDDLIYNHISARVPGHEDQFLINPYGLLFERDHRVEPGEDRHQRRQARRHALRGQRRRLRHPRRDPQDPSHDAACVLHTHSDASVAVSGQEEGLLPLSQFAMRFYRPPGLPRLRGRRHRSRRAGAAGARPRAAQASC